MVIYIAITLGSGMVDGYGQNPYDTSPSGIFYNVISFVPYYLLIEMLRDQFVKNLVGRRHRYLYLICIVFAFSYIFIAPNKLMAVFGNGIKENVELLGGLILPTIALNALLTKMALAEGWQSSAIFRISCESIYFLLPVLPDQKWITKALIGILLPLVGLQALTNNVNILERRISKRQIKNAESPIASAIVYTLSIVIIWFAVGVFPVFPTLVVTGSMAPLIKPGDVIIVQKVDPKDVQLGDIIQFRATDFYVVHRVIAKTEKQFTTKGDNNNAVDGSPVEYADVKGKYLFRIPYLGKIPLYLKSQFNQHTLREVEQQYGTGD